MKKVLIGLGVLFLILIVAVAALIGYVAYNGGKLDASSKAYVDESVPAIVSNWSKDELAKRSSPELRKDTSNGEVDRLFGELSSKLGVFKSYDGSKGQSFMNYTPQEGRVTTASYVAHATFQNGKANIDMKLILHDGSWQILGFHVELNSF